MAEAAKRLVEVPMRGAGRAGRAPSSTLVLRGLVAAVGAVVILAAMAQFIRVLSSSDAAVFGVLALAVVAAELCAVRTRRGEVLTVTFGLVLAAQVALGLPAAVLLGVLGVAVDGLVQRHAARRVAERAALLATLLLAGEQLAAGDPWLVRAVMVGWVALFVIIVVWAARRADLPGCVAALGAIVWLGFLLAGELWWTPPGLGEVAPALVRAAGFMTADTLIALGLAAGLGAFLALDGWRVRLLPTFYRYTGLALAAGLTAHLAGDEGVVGVIAGAGALVAVSAVWRTIRDREEAMIATVCALTSALDARDPYTRGHSDRVASYSVAIAEQLGWSRRRRRRLELAAHLHDVGKIGVPDAVLLKPGRFTPDEWAIMKTHPVRSWEIVRNVPDLRVIAELVRQHHERLDGSGYPDGLAGLAVSAEARILGVADSFDAMTSDRPYRAGMTQAAALVDLRRESANLFDPRMVEALAALVARDRLEAALQYAYCLSH